MARTNSTVPGFRERRELKRILRHHVSWYSSKGRNIYLSRIGQWLETRQVCIIATSGVPECMFLGCLSVSIPYAYFTVKLQVDVHIPSLSVLG